VATALLIVHDLFAVALLGAITHQTLATWAPAKPRPSAFFSRFRAVHARRFANAVVALYLAVAALGAVLYLSFKIDVQPGLELDRHWPALGLFDLKEDFVAIGVGTLPAYWVSWRSPSLDRRMRATLTAILAFVVWWSFLVGHVVNNIKGFGS